MRSHVITAALAALVAGGLSVAATAVVADRHDSSRPVAGGRDARGHSATHVRAIARTAPAAACETLARRIAGRSLSEARLRREIRRHRACRAVLVHSKAPDEAVAAPSRPRVVTIPAAATAPASRPVATVADDEGTEHEGHGEELESD